MTWRTLFERPDYCNERPNAETPLHNYRVCTTGRREKRSCLTAFYVHHGFVRRRRVERCSDTGGKTRMEPSKGPTPIHSRTNPKTVFPLPHTRRTPGGERFLLKPDCRSLLAHTENDSSHYTTKIQRNYVNTFSLAVTRLTTFAATDDFNSNDFRTSEATLGPGNSGKWKIKCVK